MKRILFITWDGPQVSYVEGLFLPIFGALGRHGYEFCVLQFTWGDEARTASTAAACATHGVLYRRADVWRSSALKALVTALWGGRLIDRAARDWKVDALMPRSLLPGLATLVSRSLRKLPVVFDSDGLAADERVDFAGMNPKGPVYRLLRNIEAASVRCARIVLVRTEAAIGILKERARRHADEGKFYVVTNGRDVAPFLAVRPKEQSRAALRLCYLGSIGPQYRIGDMLTLAAAIRRDFPGTSLSIFTQDPASLEPYLAEKDLRGADWIEVASLKPEDVPSALSQCDVGFALRTSSLSMRAAAPIKIGDYLLAGLPVIGSPDVGRTQQLVEQGCMIPAEAPPQAICGWISAVLRDRSAWRERCRKLGIETFSLERSADDYRRALNCVWNLKA